MEGFSVGFIYSIIGSVQFLNPYPRKNLIGSFWDAFCFVELFLSVRIGTIITDPKWLEKPPVYLSAACL
jgi:hypothetical protein